MHRANASPSFAYTVQRYEYTFFSLLYGFIHTDLATKHRHVCSFRADSDKLFLRYVLLYQYYLSVIAYLDADIREHLFYKLWEISELPLFRLNEH